VCPHSGSARKPAWWPAGLLFSTSPAHSLRAAGRITADLLLLIAALLQSVLGGSAVMRRGRARKTYLGERSFPLIHCKMCTAIFSISRCFFISCFRSMCGKRSGLPIGNRKKLPSALEFGTLRIADQRRPSRQFTFGCHALRHVVGGFRDQLSRRPRAISVSRCVRLLHRRHMLWAWLSSFLGRLHGSFVRLCSMGVWNR